METGEAGEIRKAFSAWVCLVEVGGELVDKENDRTVTAPGEPGMKSFSLLRSFLGHRIFRGATVPMTPGTSTSVCMLLVDGHAWPAVNHSIRGIQEYMGPMGSEELRRRRAPGFVLRRLAGELVDKENDWTVAAPGELGIQSLSSFLSLFRQSFSEPQPYLARVLREPRARNAGSVERYWSIFSAEGLLPRDGSRRVAGG